MKKPNIISDHLNYFIFSDLYNKHISLGSQRKAFRFLEIAIQIMNRKGFENITIAMVAKESGVTSPTIRYYYNSTDELKITAVKFIRLKFQKFVTEALNEQQRPDEMLSDYISRCFQWVDFYREDANVWLSFLAQCVRHKTLREINHNAVEVGRQRIEAIINSGTAKGLFVLSDVGKASQAIQTLITGGLICYASQNHSDIEGYKNLIKEECLKILTASR